MQHTTHSAYRAHLRVFVLFFVAALLFSNSLRAQQGYTPIKLSPEDENRGLNGVQKNFYFTAKDSPSDDDYQNAGYFGQRLRPYLAGNNEALENLNLYRRQKWLFLAERAVFIGSVATYGAQVLQGEGEQRYFSDGQKVTLGIAAACLLSNIFITRHTNEHFERAVNAYNAGQPAAHRTGSLIQRLAPSGIGVAATPAGQPQLALRWRIR